MEWYHLEGRFSYTRSASFQLMISPNDESQFGFETSMKKMKTTVDYPKNTYKTPHHRNLKTEA
jgi:hypothetical protein